MKKIKDMKSELKERMYFLKLLTHLGLVDKIRKTIRLNKDTPHAVKANDSRRQPHSWHTSVTKQTTNTILQRFIDN